MAGKPGRTKTRERKREEQDAAPVCVEFEYFNDFIRAFSSRISLEGVFFETPEPLEPGSDFEFTLRLGDDFVLVEGSAEVVWSRAEPGEDGAPSGMAARYTELDASSRTVIQRIVDKRVREQLPVFDLRPPPEAATAPERPQGAKELLERATAKGAPPEARAARAYGAARLREARQELSRLQEELEASCRAASEQAHALEEAKAESKRAGKKLAAAREELEVLRAAANEQARELEEARSVGESNAAALTAAQRELETLLEERDAAAAQAELLEQVRAEGERTATALAAAEEARAKLTDELENSRRKVQEVSGQQEAHEAKLREKISEARAETDGLRGGLAEALRELDELRKKDEKAERRLRKELAASNASLDSARRKLQAEGTRAAAELEGTAERRRLQRELTEARSRIERLSAATGTAPRRPPLGLATVSLWTAAVLLLVAVVYFLGSRGGEAEPEVVLEPVVPVAVAPVLEVPEPEPPAVSPEPAPPTPDPSLAREMLDRWAEAWSAQRVDDYLAHYAAGFEPAGGVAREAWEAQRRGRILRPASIEVTLREAEVETLGDGRARAVFDQSYRSDSFSDNVRKRLELVWEEERWKIVSERVE